MRGDRAIDELHVAELTVRASDGSNFLFNDTSLIFQVLLNSAAGRAYVAWKSADNVKFSEKLTFQSSDGIPSVLRLRELTEQFMGRR